MGASRSSSVSFGRSPFKNQPAFAGVELTKNLENAPAVIFRFDFWKISIFSAFVPSILKRQKPPIKTPAIIPAEAAVPVTSEISDSDEPPVFVNAETIAETISVTTDMIKVYQTRFLVANAVSFRNLCQSHPIFRSPFPINRPAKSHCSQLFVLSSFPVSYLFNKTAFYNYNTGKSKRLPCVIKYLTYSNSAVHNN